LIHNSRCDPIFPAAGCVQGIDDGCDIAHIVPGIHPVHHSRTINLEQVGELVVQIIPLGYKYTVAQGHAVYRPKGLVGDVGGQGVVCNRWVEPYTSCPGRVHTVRHIFDGVIQYACTGPGILNFKEQFLIIQTYRDA
jgi:hypothetical protein